jgi:hypothetical protein
VSARQFWDVVARKKDKAGLFPLVSCFFGLLLLVRLGMTLFGSGVWRHKKSHMSNSKTSKKTSRGSRTGVLGVSLPRCHCPFSSRIHGCLFRPVNAIIQKHFLMGKWFGLGRLASLPTAFDQAIIGLTNASSQLQPDSFCRYMLYLLIDDAPSRATKCPGPKRQPRGTAQYLRGGFELHFLLMTPFGPFR